MPQAAFYLSSLLGQIHKLPQSHGGAWASPPPPWPSQPHPRPPYTHLYKHTHISMLYWEVIQLTLQACTSSSSDWKGWMVCYQNPDQPYGYTTETTTINWTIGASNVCYSSNRYGPDDQEDISSVENKPRILLMGLRRYEAHIAVADLGGVDLFCLKFTLRAQEMAYQILKSSGGACPQTPSQVLLTVWCHISCEAAGEFWHWSLSGVKGLKYHTPAQTLCGL